MKNFLYTAVAIILFTPVLAWAIPSSIDRITDHIEPLIKTDYIKATSFTASSTSATSTFPIIANNTFRANTSAGVDFDSSNGTHIANLGVGSSANSVFYGGVNIDGTTRLATSLTGFLKAVSGTVSATSTISLNTDISGILGATNGGTGLTSTSTLLYESEIDTSAKLRGLLTDELGTGPAVFASSTGLTSPTLYSPTIITAILTGNIDAGGATSFEIPNGTAPTVDTTGEIALDTTGDQLLVADSGGTARVVQIEDQLIWSRTIASTSIAFINGSLMPLTTRLDGFTITRIQCHVTSGTSKVIAIEDASGNSSEDITCGTTNTTDDGSITNSTYTASELGFIDFGATSGAVDYVSISVFGNWTRE